MKSLIVGILIGLSLSSSPATAATLYTAADVAAHTTSTDCWTIVNNKVYNITPYISSHPGGAAAIVSICGHDGTAAFSGQHSGSANANSVLAGYYIGGLAIIADTSAPTIPTNLTATTTLANRINLSWNTSTDNVAVAGYKIFRDGTQIGTSTITTYINYGLTASTTYTYAIKAYDAAGNISGLSNSASATTSLTLTNANQKWQKYYDKKIKQITKNYNQDIKRLKQKMAKALSKTTDAERIKKITEKYNQTIKKATEKYNKDIARLNQQINSRTNKIYHDDGDENENNNGRNDD